MQSLKKGTSHRYLLWIRAWPNVGKSQWPMSASLRAVAHPFIQLFRQFSPLILYNWHVFTPFSKSILWINIWRVSRKWRAKKGNDNHENKKLRLCQECLRPWKPEQRTNELGHRVHQYICQSLLLMIISEENDRIGCSPCSRTTLFQDIMCGFTFFLENCIVVPT